MKIIFQYVISHLYNLKTLYAIYLLKAPFLPKNVSFYWYNNLIRINNPKIESNLSFHADSYLVHTYS